MKRQPRGGVRAASLKAHKLLVRSGLTLANAESCTGGWIAKLLTDHSGASAYFKGSAVVYSNAVKRRVLGVPIKNHESAVQKRIVISMAKKALALFDADLAVATSGYMEPAPEFERLFRAKRITGIAHIAAVRKRGKGRLQIRHKQLFLKGTRRQNRLSASEAALHLVVLLITEDGTSSF